MRKIFIFVLIAGLSFQGYSQIATIRDRETSEPLEFATLYSENPKATATTNIKGQADISSFKGAERIIIRSLGFKTLTVSFGDLESMTFKLLLDRSNINLDEYVVSASRWEQSMRSVPHKITAITPKSVAILNPQTAADMLGTTGEVFIQKSQQGGGSPMIRGFSTNRLLYTIDGVRMNTAIFRSGNIQNVISIDPFAIERTEVMFGPGSIIYGTDAIGGVMSFSTLTPQFTLSDKPFVTGKALTRYSSANSEKTMHFDVNVGWKKWSSVTSISSNDFGDLKMGTKGPDDYLRSFYVVRMDSVDRVVTNENPFVQKPTGYSQINMMQKVRFKPNDHWDYQYGFHYSETSAYSRYDRLIEMGSNGLPRSAVWNYGPQKWMMNLLSVSNYQSNKVYDHLMIRLAQQYFEESRIDRNFTGGNRNRLRTQLEKVNAYSANIDFEKKLNKHKLFYGLEWIINDVISEGSAINIRTGDSIPVAARYPNSTWSSYAGYLNYQYEAGEKLTAQAGLRYNGFMIVSDFTNHLEFFPFDFSSSEIFDNAIIGSLGLVYQPSSTLRISPNVSTGFRAPNVDDIGKIFDFAAGEVVVPNPTLSAEYAYNGEINISKVFNEKVKLDLTGYYTYLDNAMVRRETQVNGQDSILYNGEMSKVYAIQNAAFSNVYGAHFGIEIKLPAGFGLYSRYNYQLGKEEMDSGEESRSRHAAPAYGISRLTYAQNRLNLQFYALYSAEISNENLNEEEKQKPVIYAKDENGDPYSPGWYTLNFKAMFQFTDHLVVSAGVENLTNQRYRPYSSGIVAPGINYVMSLRATF